MSDERMREIRVRHERALRNVARLEARECPDYRCAGWTGCGGWHVVDISDGDVDDVAIILAPDGEPQVSETWARVFASARGDIAYLLAEVERLRAERDAAREQLYLLDSHTLFCPLSCWVSGACGWAAVGKDVGNG